MGIRRTQLKVDADFVQIPNAWMRDQRLSRRARGLLAELLTHRVGWHVSIGSLQKAGPEGRDAIRSAVTELVDYEYLRLSQSRGDRGRFNEIEYELCAPSAAVGFSDTGGLADIGESDTGGFTDGGPTDIGESDTKKTISIEDDSEEDKDYVQPAAERSNALESEFAEWWKDSWRKESRLDALRAFKTARKDTDLATLVDGAQAYKLLNIGQDKRHLKLPAGWLRDRRWEDEDQVAHTPIETSVNARARSHSTGFEECPKHPGYPKGDWMNPCDRCKRDAADPMGPSCPLHPQHLDYQCPECEREGVSKF